MTQILDTGLPMDEQPETKAELQNILLRREMKQLKDEVEELRADVKGLVEAWKTAGSVVVFVKWVSGVATALGVIWAAVKLKVGA